MVRVRAVGEIEASYAACKNMSVDEILDLLTAADCFVFCFPSIIILRVIRRDESKTGKKGLESPRDKNLMRMRGTYRSVCGGVLMSCMAVVV